MKTYLSLDIILRSKPKGRAWYSLLAFKETNDKGDRIPALFLNQGTLYILYNSVNGIATNYKLKSRVPFNKWFNVVVEQNSLKEKVK